MRTASFQVEVAPEMAHAFASLSGDWNPLHTNPDYAALTVYRRPVLHGAFSAGLVSRMAGMFLPGTDCLLHAMRLRFVEPIVPPATLTVTGTVVRGGGDVGTVSVTVVDASSGLRYVEASYDFGRHDTPRTADLLLSEPTESRPHSSQPVVVVTGAGGGLGTALLARLRERAIGLSRPRAEELLHVSELECIEEAVGNAPISAIVHCGWPKPDNIQLTTLADLSSPIEHYVSAPLRQILALAQLLRKKGTPEAVLILVGSTFAVPGRHNYRMPLYTLGKSLLPQLTRILALELGISGRRCLTVVFDVIDGGMNERMSKSSRASHANRSPFGLVPGPEDAAAQIEWLLENRSHLVSGAVVTLSGGAMP